MRKNMMGKMMANRKIILGFAALLTMIAIIALCSFFPFIIDPTQWQTTSFLSDELIIVAITVGSIVCLVIIGEASNAQNPASDLSKARRHFLGYTDPVTGKHVEGSVERITKHEKISAFSQWVRKVMQPRDIRSAKERVASKSGISDFSLLDLDQPELKALIDTPQKYGDKFYKSITKRQYEDLLKAKKMKIELVDPSYYLTVSKLSSNLTITEKSGGELKKKTAILSWSILSKVLVTVILAMIFASLIYDTSQGGMTDPVAWMKFANRMFAMCTSCFTGYLVGCQTNDIDADYIEMRCLAHDEFFEDHDFKPITEQEEAKEEFADRVKKESLLTYGTENKS